MMKRKSALAILVAGLALVVSACHIGGEPHPPISTTSTTSTSTTSTTVPVEPGTSPTGWLFCAMQNQGYATMGAGKIMNPVRFTTWPNGQPPCMERYFINDGEQHFYYNYTVNDQGELRTVPKIDGATPEGWATYGTFAIRDEANEWWSNTVGSKFLWLSPSAPHSPGAAPDGWPSLTTPPLPNPPNWREGCPGAFDEDASDKPAQVQERSCTNGHAPARDAYPSRALNAADTTFEAVWNTVDHDRTIFILTSDNGMISGAHKSAGKPTPYEEGLTVPMHVYVPGLPGGVVDRLVSNMDVMPTILDLTREGGIAEGFDVVVALTDDQPCIMDELGVCDTVRQAMPWLTSTVGQPGWYTFPQYRTHTSLCCPGRATLLSGQTSWHNKQFNNSPLKFNVTKPIVFDGASFVQLLLGDDEGWRSEEYIAHGKETKTDGYHGIREDCVVAAREERPCYVYWQRHVSGEVELYDLTADPWQLRNLHPIPGVGHPGYDGFDENHPTVVDLRDRLAALKATGGAS